jgi:hypothetical protein
MSASVMWSVVMLSVLGSLAQAGEPVKLDVPADLVSGLLAVSQKHGLAFVARTIVPTSGLAPVRSMVVVDTKTGKTIPTDIPAGRAILVAPSRDLALGFVAGGGQWIYDLAARKMLWNAEGPDVRTRQFTQWWGEKIVYGQIHRKGRKSVTGPLRVVDGRTGKVVAFPELYVMPLAGSPDGKQLVVYSFGKDATQPIQDLRAREKTTKSLPMIRLDAQGKELAREEIKKGSLRRFPIPTGRIRFDPTSRFLLSGTYTPQMAKLLFDAVQIGQENLVRGTNSGGHVLNLKTGKKHTIPTQAFSGILGFDGRRIIQRAMVSDDGTNQLAIGQSGASSIASITNIPPMPWGRSRVEQTPDGMMIYWIAPGTNTLHSLPVNKVTTRPWPAVTQPKKPTDAVLKHLVSRASGMSKAKFNTIIQQGQPKQGEANQPLSLWLLSPGGTVKPKKKDFAFADSPDPSGMADAMLGGRLAGRFTNYASFIRPKYITKLTSKLADGAITGTVDYQAKKVYSGRAGYRIETRAGLWTVVEFSLPDSRVRFTLDQKQRWTVHTK